MQLPLTAHRPSKRAHDLVTINEGSGAINCKAPVCIPVKGNAKVRSGSNGGSLQLLWMRGTTVVVNVATIR